MTRVRQEMFDLAMIQFDEANTLAPNQPVWLNTMASLLLDCPDQSIRIPARALKLARQSCDLTQLKQPVFIKTLALAYAELGDFNNAVKSPENALAIARTMNIQALVSDFQEQLEQFKLNLQVSR